MVYRIAFAVLLGTGLLATDASADRLCVKKFLKAKKRKVPHKNALVVVSGDAECPGGTVELLNTDSFAGPAGADGAVGANGQDGASGSDGSDGADGADGQLRIYGDGSDGALTVDAHTTLGTGSYQFTDVTVSSGKQLTIASGTVLRVSGTFTNNGSVSVMQYAKGGDVTLTSFNAGIYSPGLRLPGAGIAKQPAAFGDFGTDAQTLNAGTASFGMAVEESRAIRYPGPFGGAGGAGSDGGDGGGTLVILAMGAIQNSGAIFANGDPALSLGGGGGGGGILVLASPTSVTNDGTLQAKGGAGDDASTLIGSGGGGGGGVISIVSPSISDTGTTDVSSGSGGSAAMAGTVTTNPRMAGPAGGGSAGGGGAGGAVYTDDSSDAGSNGGAGDVNKIEADPTALF
jgi:hypothetical protein